MFSGKKVHALEENRCVPSITFWIGRCAMSDFRVR